MTNRANKANFLFLAAALVLLPAGSAAAGEDDCDQQFDSTFALLQKAVFENRGCTSALCHDQSASGGLDLRPEVAYDNLIQVPSETVPGLVRVTPGRKDASLLFVNVAAATLPGEWTAPLRPMPLALPPLSENELEALRLWIEKGAPRTGTIEGTDELLDACLPPPEPIKITPLPPPAPEAGVQLHMPPYTLAPHSETEVCFATYYDFTGQIPARYLTPDGTRFRYYASELRQDPLSHHLIVNLYEGAEPPTSPSWGTFRCRGGEKDGQVCNPTAIGFCGAGIGCATDPYRSVACFGFGPGDAQTGLNAAGVTLSQETAAYNAFVPGVYDELPVKGMILWNSHAFNLTAKEGTLEGWVNFYFAERQEAPVQDIFGHQTGSIFDFVATLFKMNVPPFAAQEVCEFEVLPPNAHLFEISSHAHRRMKRFRIFEGEFSCDEGPNAGRPCSPFGSDFDTPVLCPASSCSAVAGVQASDCNGDKRVTIDELVAAVNIALGSAQPRSCRRADANRNDSVTIDELVAGVGAALNGFVRRSPAEAMLYTSINYNDPLVRRFDPPMVMAGQGSFREERTLTYCALYDNGYTDPAEVKRQSTSPVPPITFGGLGGGPCAVPIGCVAGSVGAICSGDTPQARDRSCDSAPETGDGDCDACTLTGGVTTEDEMFLILGAYFLP